MHVPTGLRIALENDPSGWVVAYTPELPGCVSQGETIEQALINIADAISGIVEVLEEDRRSSLGGVSGSIVGYSEGAPSNPGTRGWQAEAA
jgi:predicted RNase H-like HicB family nuclease